MTMRAFLMVSLTLSPPLASYAGGLYLNEYATPSMGTAGAGAFALAEDAATSFFNPAAMTRLEQRNLMVGAGFVYFDAQFDPAPDTPVPGGDGGNAGGVGPIAALYYADPAGEKWAWGFNLVSVSASKLDFDDNWAGRFALDEISLITLSFLPGVGYRLNDEWSVGAGAGMVYGILNQEVSLPTPNQPGTGRVDLDDVDDVAFSFDAAIHWEPNERSQLGLFYASGADFELEGDIRVNPVGARVGIQTDLDLPQIVGLSGIYQLNEDWSVLASFRWEDWSSMDALLVSTDLGSRILPRNWNDTYHGSLGFRKQLSETWMLQFGGAYDSSPVDVEDRTLDMPIDRQWRLACGAQHQLNERTNIGGAFTYANYGSAEIDKPAIKGEFATNNLFLFALNVNWTF